MSEHYQWRKPGAMCQPIEPGHKEQDCQHEWGCADLRDYAAEAEAEVERLRSARAIDVADVCATQLAEIARLESANADLRAACEQRQEIVDGAVRDNQALVDARAEVERLRAALKQIKWHDDKRNCPVSDGCYDHLQDIADEALYPHHIGAATEKTESIAGSNPGVMTTEEGGLMGKTNVGVTRWVCVGTFCKRVRSFRTLETFKRAGWTAWFSNGAGRWMAVCPSHRALAPTANER